MTAEVAIREPELTPLAELRRHPRNYRQHPPAQIEHLTESFRAFGVLPTTVAARDGTILGGHGVMITAQRLGLEAIPVTRLDLDPDEPLALKLMAALNFSDKLALDDESALLALLSEVAERDGSSLLGSGWEDRDLAKLAAKLSATPPEDFADYDEDVPVDYRCPHCGYEWSGPPR